ncbi:hypothetical protein Tco_0859599 [Tanacetum coccineum]|uniref:Ribosomal protein L2 n=1 Tax=Tanacetum coccineum TaxID=301880 RepID=A0ABQ5BEQ5_9ASTR
MGAKVCFTIHPSSQNYHSVKSWGFSQLKGTKDNSWDHLYMGRVRRHQRPSLVNPTRECHVGHEKTPRSGFLYSGYSQKKHRGHITDCHVGNPYVHKYDPTNIIRDPIIEGIQEVRLEGTWEAFKGLEGSAAGYKRPSLTHICSSSFPILE